MNEPARIRLMILVETAVRPVRATPRRKQEMREELLAHLIAVFEEEATRLGNEPAALDEAARRFGNPAELTQQLQKSVSWDDRLVTRMSEFISPPGNSVARRALRHALLYLAVKTTPVLLTALCEWVSYVRGQRLQPPLSQFGGDGLTRLGLLLPYGAIAIFIFSFLAQWTSQTARCPAHQFRRQTTLAAAAVSLGIPAWAFGFSLIVIGDWQSALREIWLLFPALAVLPAFGVIFLANLGRQAFHGREGRPWLRTRLFHAAACLAASIMAVALTMAIAGDPWTALQSAQSWLPLVALLIVLDLILSAPRVVARTRTEEEWDNLPTR